MNLKKIIYNANHRGMKETDVLLGGFAKSHLDNLSLEDQSVFNNLLEELDADILSWCLGNVPSPPIYEDLIQKIVTANLS